MRKPLPTTPDTYFCPDCHGTNLQALAWVWLNDGPNHQANDYTGDDGDDGKAFCDDCQNHIRPEYLDKGLV